MSNFLRIGVLTSGEHGVLDILSLIRACHKKSIKRASVPVVISDSDGSILRLAGAVGSHCWHLPPKGDLFDHNLVFVLKEMYEINFVMFIGYHSTMYKSFIEVFKDNILVVREFKGLEHERFICVSKVVGPYAWEDLSSIRVTICPEDTAEVINHKLRTATHDLIIDTLNDIIIAREKATEVDK